MNATRLFLESGIDPSLLGDRDALLSRRAFLNLLETAAEQTSDPCFAIEFAAQRPHADLSLPEHLMRLAPTLGAGLDDACRYFGAQNTFAKMGLHRGAVEAHLTYEVGQPDGAPAAQHCELVLFCAVKCFRDCTGNPAWAPRVVHLAHQVPSQSSRHEQFFGAPVRFGQPESAIFFPTAELEIVPWSADPTLLSFLRSHARERIANMTAAADVVVQVRGILGEVVASGEVAIEEVADRMGTTPRSLQRRLRATGKSFQELLMETRLSLAKRYLEDPSLSLAETSSLLGYSDSTAFGRAFRRWTGQSPRQFRRKDL